MTNVSEAIETQKIGLPESARVWVYQSNRILTDSEVAEIEKMGEPFIRDWNAHGTKMSAAFKVLHNAFVLLGVDEDYTAASGCSIDSSVRFLRTVEEAFSITLFDRLNVAFRNDAGTIEIVTMPEFEKSIKEGQITLETTVFNNMVDTVAMLNCNWEIKASDSWHARLF